MSDAQTYDGLVEALRREFPKLRFVHKRGDPLSVWIDRALRVVTLGGQSSYMTVYVTTLGVTIFLPDGWDARSELERYVTMRHEAVHLRQFRRWTWPGMAFLYLVPVAPLGLAYGRARLEWEAYAETFRATRERLGVDAANDPRLRAHVVAQFTSAAYGWMWPFPGQVNRWIDGVLAEHLPPGEPVV